MKKSISLLLFSVAACVPIAKAYEYPLQFTPNPGYRGLVVAGYQFSGSNIVGNCSYYTVTSTSSGGGKGGGGHTVVNKTYAQTCTWDQYGNLLGFSAGAPPVPAPLYIKGTLAVYAVNAAGDFTGTDTKLSERGFVNTPGAHYSFLTPNASAVLKQAVYTRTIELQSDGDVPVTITSVTVTALHGLATLKTTTCIGSTAVGKTCSVTLTYDPTKLVPSGDDGTLQDTLRVDLTSNAAQATDFVQHYTIIVVSDDQ